MIRRIVLFGLLAAAAVTAGGIVAWRLHVSHIAALLDVQLATGRTLLQTPSVQRDPGTLLTLLGSADVNVMVRDDATGAIYNYRDGAVAGPLGPPPDPMMMPPGPPPEGEPRMPGGPIASIAHVAPRQAVAGDLSLTLVPSAASLARWFFADVAICAVALLALCIVGWMTGSAFARAARKPLARTTLALEDLAAGNFTPQTIETGDAPEIARLAHAYNAAAETVARSIEERRAAAAEFQRFLADAGHELRTPLTIVGGYIDILSRNGGDHDANVRRALAGMTVETARMRALVEKMLLLSRLETSVSTPRVVEVAALTEEVADAMRPGFPDRTIVVRADPDARIRIDEDDLYEAERNLVDNALRYAPESPVELRVEKRGVRVTIEIADRGPGIPQAEREMVFERFYRGKERTDSEGSGLGLAIVRRVVERWDGTISLDCGSNGTRFTMNFPLAQASA